MKKNVVITRSNPVRPDSRVEKEAIALVRAGYSVKVLCWDRDSDHKPCKEFLKLVDTTVPVIRIGYRASFGEGMKNIIPYLKFQFAMRNWLKKNQSEITVLHACDFDTAFFTYRIAKRNNIKVVFDIFDFIGSERKTMKQKVLSALQYDIINKSDATIICTEERKKQICGSKPKKLAIIHNTPSKDQLSENIEISDNNDNRVSVCYVGILQDGRLLREIGEYFSKNHNIVFHVGGFGYLEPYFEKLSAENPNIKFYGRIPYEETLALEKNCDIMLAIYDPQIDNHKYAAPNKFYESLFLGKPVIMVNGTGMAEVVKENEIGELIEYSESGFSKGIQNMIERKNEWPEIKERMKALYEESYNWEEMSKRLVELYSSLV